MFQSLKKVGAYPYLYYWFCFFICIGLLGFAFYLQDQLFLAPCPLCQLQRFVFLLIAILSFIGAAARFTIKPSRYLSLVIILFALSGAALAGHQVWLEWHPPLQANSCGMSLNYLLTVLPISEAIKIAIMGTGDCAAVTWRLLGLSIPTWSCMSFIGLVILQVLQINKIKTLH